MLVTEHTRVIRPAALLEARAARQIADALRRDDVSRGGRWSVTISSWQRFDRPWDGIAGTRGTAQLLGTVAVAHDTPSRHLVTIYRVAITEAGMAAGCTVDSLAGEALAAAALSLATCPRAEMAAAPVGDPFRSRVPALPSALRMGSP